jgi:diphthamide synthase (EF-2-diphthine--ammonia ligase)
MHGVRRALLLRQAQDIGLPLQEVRIPPQCVNPIYEARMREALLLQKENGVRRVAFGDIFLQDLREYRERNLAQVEMKAIFPIWKRDTRELAQEFCAMGFRAVAVCIDSKKMSREFAGREVDESFFSDLPAGVDLAAKMVSSILLFTKDRFSPMRLRSSEVKWSNVTDLFL